MKLIIEIPDNQLSFAIKVLKSFTFIKKIKPMSIEASKLLNELTDAAKEVRLHKEGKLKLKTAQDLLNEL